MLGIVVFLATSCQKKEFTLSGLVHDHFFLQSGGQNMPVTFAGNMDSGKILLIGIHSGMPQVYELPFVTAYCKKTIEK